MAALLYILGMRSVDDYLHSVLHLKPELTISCPASPVIAEYAASQLLDLSLLHPQLHFDQSNPSLSPRSPCI